MPTRKHVHQMDLDHPPERVFALLITPSAIRGWWSAARAIVIPRVGGLWVATWGPDEDDPDYVVAYTITALEPPRRLALAHTAYHAKSGRLPFEAEFTTEFAVEPRPGGCTLRVTQDGFPTDPVADAFYAACETGWHNTFDGIRRHLDGHKP